MSDKSEADTVLFERCLPALPPHQACSHLPPFLLSRSRALQNKGNSLYHKASSDIMEKADSQSGVGETQRDYCCSLKIHRFLAKLIYLKLAFLWSSYCDFPFKCYINSSENQ